MVIGAKTLYIENQEMSDELRNEWWKNLGYRAKSPVKKVLESYTQYTYLYFYLRTWFSINLPHLSRLMFCQFFFVLSLPPIDGDRHL